MTKKFEYLKWISLDLLYVGQGQQCRNFGENSCTGWDMTTKNVDTIFVHSMLVSLRGIQPYLRGIVTRFDRIL